MDWRSAYEMSTGSVPETLFLPPYVASLAYFTIVMLSGFLIRALNKMLSPTPIRSYVADFVSTTEVCSYFFENNFVLKHYGRPAFFVALVLQIFISNRTLAGSSENPIKALDRFLNKRATLLDAAARVGVQAAGGLASYRLARLVWALDMIEEHHDRYYELDCSSDLAVAAWLGFLVEMAAALVDTWLGKQVVSRVSLLDELLKSSNSALMITAGLSLTGMYFNPAMASGHMLGCKGSEAWEHFFVYWLGPFVGCLLAVLLNTIIRLEGGYLALGKETKKRR